MNIRKSRVAVLVVLGSAVAGIAAFNCSSDYAPDVVIIKDCNTAALDKTKVEEQTVALYVDTSNEMLKQATALEAQFKDACNAINATLGAPAGADLKAACNPIAVRVAAVLARAPDGGSAKWVNVAGAGGCVTDPDAEIACTRLCNAGAACDPIADCPKGNLSGTCGGGCTGGCTQNATACSGACTGGCAIDSDGGIPCNGECAGTCSAPTWTGNCDLACDVGFLGTCDGTCTGTCDGTPINQTPPVDAGPTDAGDGAVPDAGPPPPAVAPTNSPGNCPTGLCAGQCGGKSTGQCKSKCKGVFSGGPCTGGPARCSGTCRGTNLGCLGACNGACSTNPDGGACAGRCSGACDAPFTASSCAATLTCNASPICHGVCKAKQALTAKCAAADVAIVLAGDNKLYDAFLAHGKEYATAQLAYTNLINALANIQQFSQADFDVIGTKTDQARACVAVTGTTVAAIKTSLANSKGASEIIKGKSF